MGEKWKQRKRKQHHPRLLIEIVCEWILLVLDVVAVVLVETEMKTAAVVDPLEEKALSFGCCRLRWRWR